MRSLRRWIGLLLIVFICVGITPTVSAEENVTPKDVLQAAEKIWKEKGTGNSSTSQRIKYSMTYRNLELDGYGDCSSFTYRAFKDAGFGDIGTYTAGQMEKGRSDGKLVSLSTVDELQPADLIFFKRSGSGGHGYPIEVGGSTEYVSHVGIYIGDGLMYDFSSGADYVAKRDLTSSGGIRENAGHLEKRIIGAVRYFKEVDGSLADDLDNANGEEEVMQTLSKYDEYFSDHVDTDIVNTGVDDRTSEGNKQGTVMGEAFLSWVANWIWNIANMIAIILIGYISILWLIYLLAMSDIDLANTLLHKVSLGRLDAGTEGSFMKILSGTIALMIISVIVISGTLPILVGGIYEKLNKIIEWLIFIT